jgi:MFS family permease
VAATRPNDLPLGIGRQPAIVLVLLCTLSMLTYLDRVCFGAAASLIVEDLALQSVADLKWAFTAFAIAYALFEVPTGWLGDQFGPRRTLLRIVLWWSAFTLLTGLVGLQFRDWTLGGLSALIAIRFLFGAGEAGAYPNITRALHNWFPVEHWERVQGLVWMSGRLMGGLTPLLWALLVAGSRATPPLMSWRAAFALFGFLGVLWCVIFARWFRDSPVEEHATDRATEVTEQVDAQDFVQDSATPWRELLTHPTMLALCLMYFLLNYGWAFNITYLPTYLQLRFGTRSDDLLGAIYKGAPLWVGAFGCLLGGILTARVSILTNDRFIGRRIVAIASLTGCAACWIGAVRAGNIHLFCLFVSGAAFCIDMTLGASWASCQDLGRRHAAVVAAVMNTVGTLGSALAGWLTGTIVERSLLRSAHQLNLTVDGLSQAEKTMATNAGFQAVFLTYAAVYLVAAICWLAINPRRPIGGSLVGR